MQGRGKIRNLAFYKLRKEKAMLPQDPILLLSVINTKLRDYYASLDDLCDDLEVGKAQIISKLELVGYKYDKNRNQFI